MQVMVQHVPVQKVVQKEVQKFGLLTAGGYCLVAGSSATSAIHR